MFHPWSKIIPVASVTNFNSNIPALHTPDTPTTEINVIETTQKVEPLPNKGKVLKIAAILFYITTGLGLLFLTIVSTVYLCFAVRKCRTDWNLSQEYDDCEADANDIETEMMNN